MSRTVRLKHLCGRWGEYGLGVAAEDYASEGIRLIRTSDITDDGQLIPPEQGVFVDAAVVDGLRLRTGDLLISRSGTVGRSLVFDEKKHGRCTFAAYLVRFRLREQFDPRFVYYFTKSTPFAQQIALDKTQATIANFNARKLGDLQLPDVSPEDQASIGDFLDRETARIDGVISRRQQLIDLLRERRVEMRRIAFGTEGGSTRIPWLPPIANEWPVLPLRWITKCLDGSRVPLNAEERSAMPGDFPYWGANGIVDWVASYLFDENLVLLGEDGAPFYDRQRDIAFPVVGRVWVNNHIHVLRPIGVRPGYLAHYLNLVDYGVFITGTTRDKLTQEEMGRIPVPVPAEEEQIRIESLVHRQLSRISDLNAKIRTQTRLLHEHRQALVTATLTGRINLSGEIA